MNRFFYIITALIILVSPVFANVADAQIPDTAIVSSEEVNDALKEDRFGGIFDTRKNMDYITAHIPGSIGIPVNLLAGRIDDIPDNKVILFVFESEDKAEEAWNMLMEKGFNPEFIKIFGDTIENWQENGFPTEETAPRKCC